MTERDELDNALRQYKLDDLLHLIGNKSQEMYMKSTALEKVTWWQPIGPYTRTFKQFMPIWGLAELSHRAILNSNDHRRKQPTWENLCSLNNLLAKVSDETARKKSEGKILEQAKIDIFLGLAAQFWWQDVAGRRKTVYYSYLRYYLLLKEMPKHFPKLKTPESDLEEITGFGIDDFSKLLFALYAWVSMSTSDIRSDKIDKEVIEKNPVITPQNLDKCLTYFTGTYDYYRNVQHSNNPLFFKPIVQTSSNRLIISNAFIIARKFYEGIYWIIRDKYLSKNSTDFTTAFGLYYEKYTEELLRYYLKQEQFERIQNDGEADWIAHTNKYVLLIEQKSVLMSIALKRQYPSMEKFEEYLENYKKACLQLDKSEKRIKGERRPIIKFVLHFESLYFKQSYIKPKLTEIVKPQLSNLEKFYFIDTVEFEQLLQILSNDESAFERVIDKKIEYDSNPPPPADGLDFDHVISTLHGWREVKFLEQFRGVFDGIARGEVF